MAAEEAGEVRTEWKDVVDRDGAAAAAAAPAMTAAAAVAVTGAGCTAVLVECSVSVTRPPNRSPSAALIWVSCSSVFTPQPLMSRVRL